MSTTVSGAVGRRARRRGGGGRRPGSGPRNGASARPRAELLGDDRHLDARRPAARRRRRRRAARATRRRRRRRRAWRARSSSSRPADGAGPRRPTTCAAESRSARCSGERRTSISRAGSRELRRPRRRGGCGAGPCPRAAGGWRRPPRRGAAACRWPASRPRAAGARPASTGLVGSSCTAATGTSPARSSATPNTAQSSTAGWPCSTASTSAGATWKPVDLDHLLGAVGEVHPALGLEPADVAGAVPAVDEGLGVGLLGQVAGHDRRAAGLDLADPARLEHRAGVEVDDPELHAGRRQAGRVEPPRVGSVDRVAGDHRQLAGAVGGQPAHAGALGDGLGHALGDRRGAPHDVAERREVERLEVGVVGHGQGDRRHRHLEGHAVGLDAAQHLVEVEAAVQPHGGAGLGGGQQVEQAEDVRRRRGHLEAVVGGRGRAPRTQCAVARADRAVGVAHRLGQAGGARAEHEDGLVVAVRRRPASSGAVAVGAAPRRRRGR